MTQGYGIEPETKRLRRDILLNAVIVILCLVLLIQAAAFIVNVLDYQQVYTADEASLIGMVSYGDYDTLVENVHRNVAYGAPVTGNMEQLYAVAYYYEAAMRYLAHRNAGNVEQAEQSYEKMQAYEEQMVPFAFAKDEIWEFLGGDPEILK